MEAPAHVERVAEYYRETTERSYLVWGGEPLALHLGLGELPPSADRAALDRTLLATNEALAHLAQLGPGARVLDAGCGVGGSSLWLAQHRGAQVTGLTLEPGQVELAERFARERGVTGARFLRGDFTAPALPASSFDVVWNLESVCHVARLEAYVAQLPRLLAPSGRFVCGDFFLGRGGPAFDAMCAGWVLPAVGRPSALAELLWAAGFEDVAVLDVTESALGSARWMATTATYELLRLAMAEARGEEVSGLLRAHYEAAVAAAQGLADGQIVYALVGARWPGLTG